MTANVETMAYVKQSERDVPWHGLGTAVEDTHISIASALELAGLDWTVEKQPVYARRDGTFISIPDKFELMRNTDSYTLGIVGKDYVPFQNSEALAFIDHLVDGGMALDTLGALQHGKKVWLAGRLDREIQVGGEDAVNLYLLVSTSHDGTKAITAAVTPIRVVCQNTLAYGMSQAKQRWAIRHIATVGQRIDEAREALTLSFDYADAFAAEAEAMLEKAMTEAEFGRFATELLPETPKREVAVASMKELFATSPTILDTQRGTRWAAFNAVTEYLDWREDSRITPQSRFVGTTNINGKNGPSAALRAKARNLLVAV